ncbi:unnamed protein product, partial [Nezara viridula]
MFTLPIRNYRKVFPAIVKRIHYFMVLLSIAEQISAISSLLASAICHLKNIREDKVLLRKFEQLVFLRKTIEEYFGLQILAMIATLFVSLLTLAFWTATMMINMV